MSEPAEAGQRARSASWSALGDDALRAGLLGLLAATYAALVFLGVVLVATAIFAIVYLFWPRTGIVTSRLRYRLHYEHPERDPVPDFDRPDLQAMDQPQGSRDGQSTLGSGEDAGP